MTTYRVVAVDLVTGTPLDEVPFATLDYDHQPLNGHGTVGLTVSIREPRSALCRPGRTVLVIERDDGAGWDVVGHGLVWTRQVGDGATWQVGALGISSILDRLHVRETRTYTAVGQDTLAGDLLAYAQAGGSLTYGSSAGHGTDLGIAHEIVAPSTGITRDRTYLGHERKPIGQIFAQLGAVIGGYDWSPEVVRDGAGYARRISTWHPTRGSTLADVALVLGGTVDGYGAPEDATRMVTAVETAGAGEGDAMIFGAYDPGPPAGYPRLEAVFAFRDVVDQATLDGHAQALQESRSAPVSLPPLVLARPRTGWDPLTSVTVGDTVPVQIVDGTVQIDDAYRVVRRQVRVDGSTGDEAVTVDVARPAAEVVTL